MRVYISLVQRLRVHAVKGAGLFADLFGTDRRICLWNKEHVCSHGSTHGKTTRRAKSFMIVQTQTIPAEGIGVPHDSTDIQ